MVIFFFAIAYNLQTAITNRRVPYHAIGIIKITLVGILGLLIATPQLLTNFNQVIQNYFIAKEGDNRLFPTSLEYVILGNIIIHGMLIPTSGLIESSVSLFSLIMFLANSNK